MSKAKPYRLIIKPLTKSKAKYKEKKGLGRFIVSLLLSVKWLRNTVSHPTLCKPSEEDAYHALLSFQIALEKYVIDTLGMKVIY
jgi:hypothetical protein